MNMDLTTPEQQSAGWRSKGTAAHCARRDTGQARRVANFLLAWHNAEENGGGDPRQGRGAESQRLRAAASNLHTACARLARGRQTGQAWPTLSAPSQWNQQLAATSVDT